MKKRSEEMQTLRTDCSKSEPKISPRHSPHRRPPSRGHGTAKIEIRLISWRWSLYLYLQTQRVRVGQLVSSWKTLSGGMPQLSRLGPLSFTVLIDDLKAACEVHKFVDDTTFSELIPFTGFVSNMPSHLSLYSPGQPITICKLIHIKPKK